MYSVDHDYIHNSDCKKRHCKLFPRSSRMTEQLKHESCSFLLLFYSKKYGDINYQQLSKIEQWYWSTKVTGSQSVSLTCFRAFSRSLCMFIASRMR